MGCNNRRLYIAECADDGVCALALADGVVDWGICGDIHTRERPGTDVEYGAVLYDYPSARDWRWRDSQKGGGLDGASGCVGLSAAEGVCLLPGGGVADI